MGSDTEKKVSAEAAAGASEAQALSLSRALVVDDDASVAETIQEALGRVGYEVDVAASADEALTLFGRSTYDVVLSDWKLPGVDGIELITRLKDKSPTVGAILMTGYGSEETVVEAFTRGRINYYLPKPFTIGALLETVSAAVREHRLQLSEKAFQKRLEREISQAVRQLEEQNVLLEEKRAEGENLYRELQAQQAEVQETKDYLENLIESSVDAIVSTDPSFRINLFSRGAEEMFRARAETYLGRSIATLFKPDQQDLHRILELLSRGNRIRHFETDVMLADNQPLYTDISVSRLFRLGREQGLLFIIKDITARRELEEELRASNLILEKLSVTDGLTKLYNHRHFQETLRHEFERASRFNTDLGLIMLDLDDFKQVNDTFGHPIGDQVLIETAEALRQSIRRIDTPARYGGEEFAVILPQTDLASTLQVAQRIKDSLEHLSHRQTFAPGMRVTASLGVTGYFDSQAESAESMIRFADQALYRAKQIGKNRIVIGHQDGLEVIGGGERMSQAEKHAVLRRVGQALRSSLDLGEVLDYFLQEITAALGEQQQRLPCSVMFVDENRRLVPHAEMNVTAKQRGSFAYAASKAMESKERQVFDETDRHGPLSSFPIVIETPDGYTEVLGVINVRMVPPDLGFFQDLVNQAALGLRNAKLYREMSISKAALERKVDELTYLALMGMTLQRNAQVSEDADRENRKLVARCVTQIGYSPVLSFYWDAQEKQLLNGVDSSLRGELKNPVISLKRLGAKSPFLAALTRADDYADLPSFSADPADLPAEDRRLLKKLGIESGTVVLAPTTSTMSSQHPGLLVAAKEDLRAEDRSTLSLFVLHASKIMENLHLTTLHQEKNHRMSLLYDIGLNLASLPSKEDRRRYVQDTLERLIEVLQARELSVYAYDPGKKSLHLLAFTSLTARPDAGPAPVLDPANCRIMGQLMHQTLKSRKPEPLHIQDVKAFLGRAVKRRYSGNSYLGLPLMAGKAVLGVMNITDKLNPDGFKQDDLELARTAAGMLGLSLYQYRLRDRFKMEALEEFYRLVRAAESRPDTDRPGHSERVAHIAGAIAAEMGLDADGVERVRRAGFLHDIGQFSFEGTEADHAQHPARGAAMLGDWLEALRPDVLHHHEAMDGTGFPEGLQGEAIPLGARIIAVANALDRLYLTPARNQKPALVEALYTLIAQAGARFDPTMVEALLRALFKGRVRPYGRSLVSGSQVHARLAESLATPPGKAEAHPTPAMRRRFAKLLETGQPSKRGEKR